MGLRGAALGRLPKEGIYHAARRIKSLQALLAAHPDREFFVVNRILPTSPTQTVISLFIRTLPEGEDPAFDRLMGAFKAGDDAFRDQRFKYISKVPNASFMLRTAVNALGGFRPVVMGRGYLQQKHFTGPNYLEVVTDVGSSRIARGVVGAIVPQQRKLIVDECYVLEGQEPEELPERPIGLSRGVHFDFAVLNVPVTEGMLNPADEVDEVAEGVAGASLGE